MKDSVCMIEMANNNKYTRKVHFDFSLSLSFIFQLIPFLPLKLSLICLTLGDPYISDLAHTSGHVAAITNVLFHPLEEERMLTSSCDSTLRIWDVNKEDKQLEVLKFFQPRGRRISATTCAFGERVICFPSFRNILIFSF